MGLLRNVKRRKPATSSSPKHHVSISNAQTGYGVETSSYVNKDYVSPFEPKFYQVCHATPSPGLSPSPSLPASHTRGATLARARARALSLSVSDMDASISVKCMREIRNKMCM